ncbi:MAG: hypothetical protein ASARMPREDX12_002135 [Alectoria sarmentosa]|nr:MAG: hypothetical protein ASARMPREDX12_002135 [Alectoria sarmentosa]
MALKLHGLLQLSRNTKFGTALRHSSISLITKLPPEILTLVFEFSSNVELKTLRLTCRYLYDTATPLLFNSVFVSARQVDLQVADLVASKFSNSIQTLTFSSGCFFPSTLPEFRDELKRHFPICHDLILHDKTSTDYWELYTKLGSEGRTLYERGAVHARLLHLLKTLPNLRQVVITDRRRRQDLSWFQEALMSETAQCFPPSQTCISPSARLRRALASLPGLRKRSTPFRSYSGKIAWARFLSSFTNEVVQAVEAVLNIGCNCLDKEPSVLWAESSGLGLAGLPCMPQNPWVDLMTTLQTCSDAPINTISIQPRDQYNYLPFPAFEAWKPYNFHASASLLARLTKLELCLMGGMTRTSGALIETYQVEHRTKILSMASNLQSLKIGFPDWAGHPPLYAPPGYAFSAFDVLLGGCKLPHLSALHLSNLWVYEEAFSVCLQHSPDLSDLALQGFSMLEVQSGRLETANPKSWERLLHTIRGTLRHLQHFHISSKQLLQAEHETLRGHSRADGDMLIQRFVLNGGVNPFEGIVRKRSTEDY